MEIKEEFLSGEKQLPVRECNLFQIPEARLSDDWGMVKRKRVCNEGRIIEFALGGWMNIPKQLAVNGAHFDLAGTC